MVDNAKLIGLFVARTFEENNLNFIHAMQNLGQKEGRKLVIFSLDTTDPVAVDRTVAEMELCSLSEYLSLDAFVILGETIKNRDLIDGIHCTEKADSMFLSGPGGGRLLSDPS